MSDIWDSFTEYVKTRLTNPFLATLIVVWIIRNFTFVFSLFNFDSGETREQKLKYIGDYIETHETWEELGWNILISFCVILSSFLLLLLARALTNGYAYLLSILNKHTAKSTMIEVELHNDLLLKYTDLKKERDTLRSESSAHDKQLNDMLGRLTSKTEEAKVLETELKRKTDESLNDKNKKTKLEDEVEDLQRRLGELISIDKNTLQNLDQIPNYDAEGLTQQFFDPAIVDSMIVKELIGFRKHIIYNYFGFKNTTNFGMLKKVQRHGLDNLYASGGLLEMLYYFIDVYDRNKADIYVDSNNLERYFEADLMVVTNDRDNENGIQYKNLALTEGGRLVYGTLIKGTSFTKSFSLE